MAAVGSTSAETICRIFVCICLGHGIFLMFDTEQTFGARGATVTMKTPSDWASGVADEALARTFANHLYGAVFHPQKGRDG